MDNIEELDEWGRSPKPDMSFLDKVSPDGERYNQEFVCSGCGKIVRNMGGTHSHPFNSLVWAGDFVWFNRYICSKRCAIRVIVSLMSLGLGETDPVVTIDGEPVAAIDCNPNNGITRIYGKEGTDASGV